MTIDWNAPLEAYHTDGRVVEVVLDMDYHVKEGGPDADGEYRVIGIEGDDAPYFNEVGERWEPSEWQIRNRTEKPAPQYPVELVERAFELCAEIAATNHPVWAVRAARITQEAQLADPDPVEHALQELEASDFSAIREHAATLRAANHSHTDTGR